MFIKLYVKDELMNIQIIKCIWFAWYLTKVLKHRAHFTYLWKFKNINSIYKILQWSFKKKKKKSFIIVMQKRYININQYKNIVLFLSN